MTSREIGEVIVIESEQTCLNLNEFEEAQIGASMHESEWNLGRLSESE